MVKALREPLLSKMMLAHGIGEEQYKKDVALKEDLFSQIDKSVTKQREQGVGDVLSKVSAHRSQSSSPSK